MCKFSLKVSKPLMKKTLKLTKELIYSISKDNKTNCIYFKWFWFWIEWRNTVNQTLHFQITFNESCCWFHMHLKKWNVTNIQKKHNVNCSSVAWTAFRHFTFDCTMFLCLLQKFCSFPYIPVQLGISLRILRFCLWHQIQNLMLL